MTTVKYQKNCDLCGLSVEIEGFTLKTDDGVMSFCCAGCQSIYKLIHTKFQPTYIDKKTNNNNEVN